MRKTIQHAAVFGKLRRCPSVILLIEEKTGLLTVDVVHIVFYAVFLDDDVSVSGRIEQKADGIGESLLASELALAALVHSIDLLSELAQI